MQQPVFSTVEAINITIIVMIRECENFAIIRKLKDSK
jgi:hypothetical protein